MYTIYFDDTLAISPKRPGLMAIDPVIELEENTAGTLIFALPPTHPYYDQIAPRLTKISVYFEEEADPRYVFFADRITTDSRNIKTVECYGDMAVLAESIVPPVYNNGLTVRQLLERYVGYHNAHMPEEKQLTVGVVTVSDPNDAIYCYGNYQSTWDEIKEDLLDDLGGILRTRHQGGVTYLDYYADAPRTCAQKVQFGRNLLELATNMDAADICTAVIPLGKVLEESERTSAAIENLDERVTIRSVNHDLDYVANRDLVDTYGWVFRVVVWDDVATPAILKKKGIRYLEREQFAGMQLEATAVDLSLAGMSYDSFQLSDDVPVLSQPHGIDQVFRLTAMTLRLNEPARNVYRLGAVNGTRLTTALASMQASSASGSTSINVTSSKHGKVLCNATAGKRITTHVSFESPFNRVPIITGLTPYSKLPNVVEVSATNVTTTGFDIVLYRNDNTATTVAWEATGDTGDSPGADTPGEEAGGDGGGAGVIGITPEQYGAAGDGTTDDTKAMQDAIAAAKAAGQRLISGKGKAYLIKSTLDISGVDIDFGGATIKAGATTTYLLTRDDTGSDQRRFGQLCNVVLDCDNKAGGINIVKGLKYDISLLNVLNCSGNAVRVGSGSSEVFLRNSHLNGNGGASSCGIRAESSDCHFTDVVVINLKTAIYSNGMNYFTRVHGWNTKSYSASTRFLDHIAGAAHLVECYADTYQYSIYNQTDAPIELQNCNFYSNPSHAPSSPYVFYFTGTNAAYSRKIHCVGCTFDSGGVETAWSNNENNQIQMVQCYIKPRTTGGYTGQINSYAVQLQSGVTNGLETYRNQMSYRDGLIDVDIRLKISGKPMQGDTSVHVASVGSGIWRPGQSYPIFGYVAKSEFSSEITPCTVIFDDAGYMFARAPAGIYGMLVCRGTFPAETSHD